MLLPIYIIDVRFYLYLYCDFIWKYQWLQLFCFFCLLIYMLVFKVTYMPPLQYIIICDIYILYIYIYIYIYVVYIFILRIKILVTILLACFLFLYWISHFVHVSFSWFHLVVCSSLSSFKIFFWNSLSNSLGSLLFFRVGFWSFIASLGCIIFAWFFSILVDLHLSLCSWRSMSPLPVFTNGFGRYWLSPVGFLVNQYYLQDCS